jgi:hypothetical protein
MSGDELNQVYTVEAAHLLEGRALTWLGTPWWATRGPARPGALVRNESRRTTHLLLDRCGEDASHTSVSASRHGAVHLLRAEMMGAVSESW